MSFSIGALNSKGFSSSISSGELPPSDHLTYEGVFNELCFPVGPRATKECELHIGFCRSQYVSSLVDAGVRDYLALFLKGSSDGQPRDSRVLNSVIVLDISGSMSGQLTRKAQEGAPSRLALAKEAISMFYGKLRDSDCFGLVVFDTSAKILVPCTRKGQLDAEHVFSTINQIHTQGGTNLRCGFEAGTEALRTYFKSLAKDEQQYENRLVMLTDVNDNMGVAEEFIRKVSEETIHTTIVGISEDFRSETCQRLSEIRGFNYFCATENEDLKKHLFENFDYTFFPAGYDISIEVESDNVQRLEVFGTPDKARVAAYNGNFADKERKSHVITRLKSSFPSELELREEQVLTHGGLILVKLLPREERPSFMAVVSMTYVDVTGEKGKEEYKVAYELPEKEQFFTEESLYQAMQAYHFVNELKHIIDSSKGASKEQKTRYLECLEQFKSIAPKQKLDELTTFIAILQS